MMSEVLVTTARGPSPIQATARVGCWLSWTVRSADLRGYTNQMVLNMHNLLAVQPSLAAAMSPRLQALGGRLQHTMQVMSGVSDDRLLLEMHRGGDAQADSRDNSTRDETILATEPYLMRLRLVVVVG